MSKESIQKIIDTDLAYIITHEDDPHALRKVTPTRPNRPVVLSVRLTSEEMDKLTNLASEEHLPISTLARKIITHNLGIGSSLEETVERVIRRTIAQEMLQPA